MPTFEPQHISIRNLVLSAKIQAVYGTALADADLTKRPRFDGSNFATVGIEHQSDDGKSGKGHDWPTLRNEVGRSSALSLNLDATDDVLGILSALVFGKEQVSGGGPYTHLFTFLTTSRLAKVTTIYVEDTADILSRYIDMAAGDLKISGADRGPLAVSASLMGSGRFTDGAIAAMPAIAAPVYLFGQDTDILIGAPGGAVSKKERIRSWEFGVSNGLAIHKAPGGGLYSVMSKVDRQRATLKLRVAAKDADDLRTLYLNNTLQEVQINTNSGAAAQLNIKFPGLRFVATPAYDGAEMVWDLTASETDVIKNGGSNYVEVTVINGQAAYLVAA